MKNTGLLVCALACVAALFSNCVVVDAPGPTGPHTGNTTLTIVNNSSTGIGWVYISASSSSLGSEQLGISTISVGSTFDITGITAGYHYIRAVHLYTHDTAYVSMTFTAGHSYTWTLTDSDFPSTSNATLTVVNNSTATIWNLYMSTSSSTLGIDQLATSTISAGSTYNITGIAPGYYYLRAVHSGTYDTAYTTQTFAAGQSYTWTLTNSDFPGTSSATLTVVNNSATTIGWVYMSTSSLSIGTDRLGISSISAGSAFNITGIAPGYYHIRAVHLNTHDTAYSDITIAAGQTYSWTLTGSDFSGGSVVGLKVINNSSYTINYVYLSKSNTAWGSDWLGSNTIFSGYYYIIPNVPTGTVNSKFVTSGSGLNSLHLLNIPGNGSDSITLTDSDFPNYLHGSLKVVNNWTSSIYYLKYRLTGTTAWSTDQLGTSTIISGGQYQLNLITPGTYDFLVLSSGQTYSLELDNQVISDGQLLTWTVPGLY